ncbi:MAG: hypothetical protein DWQ37_18710 [Planctomycetota bacterium]|nr:MAG: hypothetical protein DWQ37_18710 [Planctomycetota bacterium]
MKCEEFERRLDAVLDVRRRPEWDVRLRAHAEQCAPCRRLAASYGVLLDGVAALPVPEPSADLTARVMSEMRVRPAASRRVALVGAVLATAAAVVVALLPLLPKRDQRVATPDPLPAYSFHTTEAAVEEFDWANLDELPVVGPVLISIRDDDETTDPYEELAKGTGQGLASVVLYMPGVAGPRGFIGTAPAGMRSQGVFPEQMSQELEPVRESVAETINLLLRAVPLADFARRS